MASEHRQYGAKGALRMSGEAATAGGDPARPVFSESYWTVLAGLRFVLAAIVAVGHMAWFATLPPAMGVVRLLGGRSAVLGFLLISGISIGHSYAERPEGYFKRRFLRIYPLYCVAVCFSQFLAFALSYRYALPGITLLGSGLKTAIANLFFLQGFLAVAISFNGPLWTLSVEVFYYVLAPWLARRRPLFIAGLIVVSMALFLFVLKPWDYMGVIAMRYGWPWLIGFLFAYKGQRGRAAAFALLGVLVTAANKVDTAEPLSWATFAVPVAIAFCPGVFRVPDRMRKPLNYLGELSYPLYLFHVPLYLFLYRYAGIRQAWMFLLLAVLLTAVLNQVIDHWLKDRFWKPVLRLIPPRRRVSAGPAR